MTQFAWPRTWAASRFEMRIMSNTRIFTGPYTPTTQVIDLLGERWTINFDIANDIDPILGAAREAFFDRLAGPANQIAIWNLVRPIPAGTMRGTPTIDSTVAQLANILPIVTAPRATLLAGDQIGVNGQLCRVMANAVADGSGAMSVEVRPRMRAEVGAGAEVLWDHPTANMMLKADGVPVSWRPGLFELSTLDLIEAL